LGGIQGFGALFDEGVVVLGLLKIEVDLAIVLVLG